MTDQTDTTAALEAVTTELAQVAVPSPDDILSELSPLAQLYFVEQLAWELLRSYAAMGAATEGDEDAESSNLSGALTGIGVAAGALDESCVLMGLLPPEAVPSELEGT